MAGLGWKRGREDDAEERPGLGAPPRRSSDGGEGDDPPRNAVAEHYNVRARISTLASRRESPILQLRSLNNWVKSVLLGQYLRQGHKVFDMCCGRGGDLLKFDIAGVSYVFGADIAGASVEEARRRHAERRLGFAADFVTADCFKVDLEARGLFPPGAQFDLVSCQFALHYAFETEESARTMMANVAARLRPGGVFVGTVPNAAYLVKRLRAISGTRFGNSVYEVAFDRRAGEPARFGERYTFFLRDAIDSLPEYLAHFPTLAAYAICEDAGRWRGADCRLTERPRLAWEQRRLPSLAAEHGLQVELHDGFHKFFYDHCDEHRALLSRMRVLTPDQPEFDPEQWEAAGVYDVFVFRKR